MLWNIGTQGLEPRSVFSIKSACIHSFPRLSLMLPAISNYVINVVLGLKRWVGWGVMGERGVRDGREIGVRDKRDSWSYSLYWPWGHTWYSTWLSQGDLWNAVGFKLKCLQRASHIMHLCYTLRKEGRVRRMEVNWLLPTLPKGFPFKQNKLKAYVSQAKL